MLRRFGGNAKELHQVQPRAVHFHLGVRHRGLRVSQLCLSVLVLLERPCFQFQKPLRTITDPNGVRFRDLQPRQFGDRFPILSARLVYVMAVHACEHLSFADAIPGFASTVTIRPSVIAPTRHERMSSFTTRAVARID
jgi:hypothetical protein